MKFHHFRYRDAVFAAIWLLANLWGYSAPLYAQQQLTEQDYFAEIPLVLSATRLPQSAREAPVAITVIDREMIEASGYTEIPDLLRLVPGFLVDYDSGHIQAASYHMLTNRFVRQQQVLIDGRSVYSPNFGGVPWTELPITIDDIERIEVVRGSNAATYGSNSMLGVINIITRDVVLDRGTSLRVNAGSNNLRETFLRYGNSSGKLDYRLSAAYRADDGFEQRYDGKIVRLFDSHFDYQLNAKDSLSFQAGYSEGPREEDNTLDTAIPDHVRETFSQYQQAKWQHTTSSTNEYSLQFYHTQLAENKSYTRTDIPILIDEYQNSERYDLEFQQVLSPFDGTRVVWGASYRLDKVLNPLYLGTQEALEKRTRRLFGHAEHRLTPQLSLNAGLMLEDNDITGTEFSPRVAFNYDIGQNDTLRVSYSRATRTPTLFEEYPNTFITNPFYDQVFIDNGSIESETVDNYELAWVGHSNDRKLIYDAKIFREDIEGLITYAHLTPFPDIDNRASYFDNFDDAKITGFEGSLDYRPNQDIRIYLTYANIDIESDNVRDQYATSAPEHSAYLMSIFKLPDNYGTSFSVYYRSEMKPLARRTIDPETMPEYTRVDWRLSKTIDEADTKQQIAFVVQNLFDNVDTTILNNFKGREYYFTYKIHFR
ncbi:MAG: TonB-dependent receptor [Thioalkalispiraceae bacterium]